jgi:hypothetical protein
VGWPNNSIFFLILSRQDRQKTKNAQPLLAPSFEAAF